MRNEYVVANDLFAFDYFKCLRSEYAKNACSLCIELCPEEAMVFDRARLTLDTQKCTGCAACMGICPTEALASRSFDAESFVLEFAEGADPNLSCKENVPCLAALSPEHYVSIALRREGATACDLSHCAECGVNREGRVYETITAMLDEADRFLAAMGADERIGREPIHYEAPETAEEGGGPDPARRALFRKLAGAASGEEGPKTDLSELAVDEEERQPLKRLLLKNAMKKRADAFGEETTRQAAFSFAVGKRIDAMACNNCQECAMFCPTGALSVLKDNTGIVFQSGKCIACGICNDICQPRAMHDDDTFDPVDFAFDRMALLVKHDLQMCEECKVAFPYKGGEKICDRCRDFRDSYSDLFTLAKDLE